MDFGEALHRLFDAERTVRGLHTELSGRGAALLKAAQAAFVEAQAPAISREERSLRLVRLAHLAGEIQAGGAVDLLVDILGDEEPEPRQVAGEILEDLAFDRFKEVALAVERALERLPDTNLALSELPFILSGVPEPGVLKLLAQFLKREGGDVVAAAVEAIVECGEPDAAKLLAPLRADKRVVTLDEDDPQEATIGELAEEAFLLLSQVQRVKEPRS